MTAEHDRPPWPVRTSRDANGPAGTPTRVLRAARGAPERGRDAIDKPSEPDRRDAIDKPSEPDRGDAIDQPAAPAG